MFDYSKLLGKMREKGLTQAQLASAIGVSISTLNHKLRNVNFFRQDEIWSIMRTLCIPVEEVEAYFFTVKP